MSVIDRTGSKKGPQAPSEPERQSIHVCHGMQPGFAGLPSRKCAVDNHREMAGLSLITCVQLYGRVLRFAQGQEKR